MKNKMLIPSFIITIVVIAMIFGINLVLNNTKYGLDLKGGFEVLYQVETIDDSKLTDSMVTNTYKTILKRIDVLGVSEPNISIEGKDKIRIQLAGINNADEARRLLSTTANLTFRDVEDNLILNSDVLVSGGATISTDEQGRPAVGLSVRNKDAFFEGTSKISSREPGSNLMVIWLDFDEETDNYQSEGFTCGTPDSNCLSAATVSRAFSSDVIIQGNFTLSEVGELVELINSGSLPTKLNEISSKTVDAAFGVDSLNKTLSAGIIGIILIIVTMISLYRFAGIVTGISIVIYTFLVFLLFYLIGGVLTLPGIAALLIGIGMAVDANVITFSRIKEELYEGRSLAAAFINGNKRSLITILDANVTTLLVAVILFVFGESSVKGFATMFIITIVVTLFVMFLITRIILKLFVESKIFDNKLSLFIGAKQKYIKNITKKESKKYSPFKNLNFISKRKIFYSISTIIIIIGALTIFFLGLNLGIDYKGGSSITIKTNTIIDTIEQDFDELKLEVINIEKISDGYDVRIIDVLDENTVISTSDYFEEKYNAATDIGVISNIVKEELIRNAILSIILAAIGIVIYITIRYRFSYAISAIIALLHDVFIVVGLFSIFRIEIDAIFIAALLAIIGYSINDTIICFDRIRETIMNSEKAIKTKEELQNVVNESIRNIFMRSIITSLTTLIPITTLILLGSYQIFNFNIALFIGLIAGTYSSIFIAAQIWYEIEKRNIGKDKHKKSRWHDYIEKDELEEMKVKGINS